MNLKPKFHQLHNKYTPGFKAFSGKKIWQFHLKLSESTALTSKLPTLSNSCCTNRDVNSEQGGVTAPFYSKTGSENQVLEGHLLKLEDSEWQRMCEDSKEEQLLQLGYLACQRNNLGKK